MPHSLPDLETRRTDLPGSLSSVVLANLEVADKVGVAVLPTPPRSPSFSGNRRAAA